MPIVSVNVGGHVYQTTEGTLARKGGLLARLFDTQSDGTRWPGQCAQLDEAGRPFIDRDGPAFAAVLAWLRTGVATVTPGTSVAAAQRELDYYFPGPDCPLASTDATARVMASAWLHAFMVTLDDVRVQIRNRNTKDLNIGHPFVVDVRIIPTMVPTIPAENVIYIGCIVCPCYKSELVAKLYAHPDRAEMVRVLTHWYGASDMCFFDEENKRAIRLSVWGAEQPDTR